MKEEYKDVTTQLMEIMDEGEGKESLISELRKKRNDIKVKLTPLQTEFYWKLHEDYREMSVALSEAMDGIRTVPDIDSLRKKRYFDLKLGWGQRVSLRL
jgi:hypothetical protein